jgi:hypothetical protein
MPEATPAHLLYLIVDPTVMRAEPHAAARTVAKLKRFDIVSGREMVTGWLQVDGGATVVAGELGWVPLARENLVRGPLEMLRGRLFRVQHTKWPDRIKLDVIRGRIREGFTADQVRLALGDPIRRELRETAGDVAEEWLYEDRRVLFSHTGVRVITSSTQ